MSIRDTISAALSGTERDELAAAAHKKVTTQRDKLTGLQASEETIKADLARVEGDIDNAAATAAETGDRKGYEAAKRKRTALHDDLELNRAAQRRCSSALQEAEAELRKARSVDRLKVARRHANERAKSAQKITDGVALMFDGWASLHNSATKIVAFGGHDFTDHPGALGILRNELKEYILREMARVSSSAPNDYVVPSLPGTPSYPFDGDPKAFKPLVEVIAEANSFLLRRVEGVPEPVEPQQKQPNPAADTAAQDEQQQQPAEITGQQTFDAAQVLASIMPKQLA